MAAIASHMANRLARLTRGLSTFATIEVGMDGVTRVADVQLNRPKSMNAFSGQMMSDLRSAMESIGRDAGVRAVVLHGGPQSVGFSAGLDLIDHAPLLLPEASGSGKSKPVIDPARRALLLHELIQRYQASVSSLEACRVPVIAAVHGPCIGAGFDLVTAADVRLATKDAYFCAAEVSIGLCPDIGLLQRLPRVIGNDSLARELAYTGRNLSASEAMRAGLLSSQHEDRDSMLAYARALASRIASHSPIAVIGTKANLNYSRGRTVGDGLSYNAAWSAAMLQTADIPIAATEAMARSGSRKKAGGGAGSGAVGGPTAATGLQAGPGAAPAASTGATEAMPDAVRFPDV